MNEEYYENVKSDFKEKGWKLDRDDENFLQFSLYVDENIEWMKDYNKKSNTWFHYNGREKINLISTKEVF